MPHKFLARNFFIVLILLLLTGGGFFLVRGSFNNSISAAPQNVTVAEARSTTVSVTWLTADKTPSNVYYGTTQALGMSKTSPGLTTAHLVEIENLTPGTTYYFQVGGDGSIKFAQDGENGIVPFTFRTLAALVPEKTVADAALPSPFGKLIGNTVEKPNLQSRVLAESTGSAGNNPGGDPGDNGNNNLPQGGSTIFTVFMAAVSSVLLGFGFKLLKK